MPGARVVAMTVKVFTGSADDVAVGKPGLYHWFEHSPFRGTESFPTMDSFAVLLGRHATQRNASTGRLSTSFDITVPETHWREGLTYGLDLVARPLLTNEGIKAEQEIILSEISDSLADPEYRVDHRIDAILFPDHPTSHPTLGTEESILSMDANTIRRAHREGYSWNRVIICVSGGVATAEVADFIWDYISRHPMNALSERRSGASHGPCLLRASGSVQRSESSSTFVRILIPIAPYTRGSDQTDEWTMTYHMFAAGGMQSPLMKVLRQERPLVYGANMGHYSGPDRWYFIVEASTRPGNGEEVLQEAKRLFTRADLLDRERLNWVHDYMLGNDAHITPNPRGSVNDTFHALSQWDQPLSHEERQRRQISVPYDRIRDCIETLAVNLEASAATFVFEGNK